MQPLFCFIASFLFVFSSLHATSVTIIGAGPAGLAAAIESQMAGAEVTIIEKRQAYSRPQWLFLDEQSLALLEKWHVTAPSLSTFSTENGKMGIVQINQLEYALAARVQALGITRLQAEFVGF